MRKIYFCLPDYAQEYEIKQFMKEFSDNKEFVIDGSAGLQDAKGIALWINTLEKRRKSDFFIDGYVPSTVYLACNQIKELVGIVDIRNYLNDALLYCGGHIGYSVRPSKRNQGYGCSILWEALEICKRENKFQKVLLTCSSDNIPSIKIIIKNGGKYENAVVYDGKMKNRYWIDLML